MTSKKSRPENRDNNAIIHSPTIHLNPAYPEATGPIDYGLTNDYMFRAMLQKNEEVLRGLVCSVLHLETSDIRTVKIINPILLGESFDAKDFILDIHVLLNNSEIINLEMQVINALNWPERSLSYLCRCFDNVNRGKDYSSVIPVHHIGFLDFQLFENSHKFYSTYHLFEDDSLHQFTSKFTLSVIDLTHIEQATSDDKKWQVDKWATLFKAKTWEELRMIASGNETMQAAANNLFILNADLVERERARARQDAIDREASYQRAIAERDEALTEKNNIIIAKDEALTEKNSIIIAKDDQIARLKAKIAELESQI